MCLQLVAPALFRAYPIILPKQKNGDKIATRFFCLLQTDPPLAHLKQTVAPLEQVARNLRKWRNVPDKRASCGAWCALTLVSPK